MELHELRVRARGGRGGGCSYIGRYLQPRSVCGVDLSGITVRYSCERHRVPSVRQLSPAKGVTAGHTALVAVRATLAFGAPLGGPEGSGEKGASTLEEGLTPRFAFCIVCIYTLYGVEYGNTTDHQDR